MVVAWRHEAAGALRVADGNQMIDREAEYERLVPPLKERMMRAVWRVTRDPALAEDAFQEALVTTWRKLPEIVAHPNPPALVMRICLNAAVDQLRGRGRRQRLWAPLEGHGTPADAATPETALEERELRESVLTALARLKGRQATALLMRAVDEQPYSVIADALGCSEPTARVHVQRARDKLRGWLGRLQPPRGGEGRR